MNDSSAHYDRVTEAWRQWVMGEALHFGLFTNRDQPLREATDNLTQRLIDAANIAEPHRVLDVGCGIGTPARAIARRCGCHVVGITTSQVGLTLAQEATTEPELQARTQFVLADALETEFEDDTFDRIFALESFHLMSDHDRLFAELFRVLQPGGRLALCDVTMVTELQGRLSELEGYRAFGHSQPVAERMQQAVHRTMHRAFGSVRFVQATQYIEAARKAGFIDITTENISSQTRPTLEHWGRNAQTNAEALSDALGPNYLDDLFLALFHMSMGWGRHGGYVVMTADKLF
ncbi:MAG: methyltransferase domain-containing protein [Myxococcota bacterium]